MVVVIPIAWWQWINNEPLMAQQYPHFHTPGNHGKWNRGTKFNNLTIAASGISFSAADY